ncbi:MAG: hypothetical protein J6D26_00610 [Clostridia bacterium]|nr:hypothetical protein [Clostridia bacterium]
MKKICLNGEWLLRKDGVAGEIYKATVPGDIHKDLLNAGVIDDPYYSDNSHRCGWVAETDWRYIKTFTADSLDKITHLIFEGIDTIAEIYLNGIKIADTDNMFYKYRLDVSDYISQGENTLEVVIKSIRNELKKYPDEGYFGCFNVQRIFVRKAQCHFSWDWAPDFPAAGIWKDVYIESISDTYINDYKLVTQNDGSVTFFVNMPEDCDYGKEREIEITLDGKTYSYTTTDTKNFFTLKIDNPKLWWPRFLGEPYLYDYNIKLFSDSRLQDEKSGRIGIRSVKFEQLPTEDGDGFTCQLYINDTPVYLKGANWVPLDVMTGCIDKETYEKAIKLAYDANFSMLRVWGGGIYESDTFFEICDELGIMVWQDFAYACADVPDNIPEFVEKAVTEAEYQVQRLRNFTSLVLYCGGNEKTGSHGLNKKYGDRIIYYYIRGVVDHLDGTRPYFPSSPWGYGDIGNTQSSGDCHCNSYQKSMISPENPDAVGIENFRDALKHFKASLVSEIAVQGAPTISSLKKYIPDDKLWPINEIYDIHFMCNPYDGTGKMFPQIQLEAAQKLFGDIDSVEDFCKKSSTLHSELVRADCEYHKTRIGKCSGTMTWMFNDIWPCGTWSVVDHYLTPMPAYYSLKRAFYANNLIITKTVNGYELFAVNETNAKMGYSVEFGVSDLQGNIIGCHGKKQGLLKEYSSELITIFNCDDTDNCFMYAKGIIGGDERDATIFSGLWKDITFAEPGLSVEYEEVPEGIKARISTKNYARVVNIACLNREDLIYSDNYFDMMPGSVKTVMIKGKDINIKDLIVRNWLDKWEF